MQFEDVMSCPRIASIFAWFCVLCPGSIFAGMKTPEPFPKEAWVGYAVREVKSGKWVAKSESERNFVPGSALKLFTAQLALNTFSPDTSFVTRLLTSGSVKKQVLEGDLVIRGDGDPALGSREFGPNYRHTALFEAWTDSLKVRGIEQINGNILADASALTNSGADPGFLFEDVGNYYAGLATGLAFLDNAYAIRFQGTPRVGERFVLLGTEPLATGISTFDNQLLSGKPQSRDSAYIFGTAPAPIRSLRGTYPAGHWEFQIRGSLPDPGWTLTREFLAYLQNRGIRVRENRPPAACAPPDPAVLAAAKQSLASWRSPPIKDLVKRMLVSSDNHVAAHLLAQAARAKGLPPSREGGLLALKQAFAERKIPAESMVLYDGAGLSPLNRVSPEVFCDWLRVAALDNATFPILKASLLGSPGTEARIERYGATLKGRLWIKTGTLEGVAALAGYLETRTGKTLAFCIFANHFSGSSHTIQNAFGSLLAQWAKL
jgi:serine-type D-Ala-D-Ala carboxypeptidase/endopeptidase (penicillin-binding protein 4)